MKINSFNIVNFGNISRKTQFSNKLERVPNSDVVSFGGKKKREAEDVIKATTFGTQLYKSILDKNVTFQDVKEKIQDYSTSVSVRPMNELSNTEIDNYRAYSISNLKEDFSMTGKEIYLKLPSKDADEISKMLFAMEAGHEYTHIRQGENIEVTNAIKEIANGDYEYAKIIMGVAEQLFKPFDNRLQHNTLLHTFTLEDRNNAFKYGSPVPRALNVDEKTVFKGLNVRDKKEFEEMMNSAFMQVYSAAVEGGLLTNEQVVGHLPEDKKGIGFFEDLRKYCALSARNEAEAYTTESRICKKITNTNKSLNIDVTPIYYNMLAECFEKPIKK